MARIRFETLLLIAAPTIAALAWSLFRSNGLPAEACWCAAVALICVIWWIGEPIPIPITSLVPLAVLPLVNVLTPKQVALAYGSPLILLLLGGFLLSTAMSSSGAHKRLALHMVNLLGRASGRRVVLGFMLASAMLSMWISNTATTLMLMPVAMAVLEDRENRKLATPLLLGLAYSASLGGIGTPIGTPPNLVFMQVYADQTGTNIGFTRWMGWTLPIIVLFLPVMWLMLTRSLPSGEVPSIPHPGRWRSEERRVLTVFGLTAAAWVTRTEPFGGWSAWLGLPNANDASVALLAVVLLGVIPNGRGGRLLEWEDAVSIPWGVLLLFGGGICLATGFAESGLSLRLGAMLTSLAAVPTIVMISAICLSVTFLTETTSNTASTALLMPILASAAHAMQLEPALLMVPAALSASCAFMLPVATAPNSIIFGSGFIRTSVMAREGFFLNLIGALIITSVCYLSL